MRRAPSQPRTPFKVQRIREANCPRHVKFTCQGQRPVVSWPNPIGQGTVPMAGKQESVVLVAIARAASKYGPLEWFGLPPSQRTRAIYRELQQLDAAASGGGLQDVASARHPVSERI